MINTIMQKFLLAIVRSVQEQEMRICVLIVWIIKGYRRGTRNLDLCWVLVVFGSTWKKTTILTNLQLIQNSREDLREKAAKG